MILTFIRLILRNILFPFFSGLCLLTFPLYSQVMNDYGFIRSYHDPVVTRGAVPMNDPWVGGLNSCHFSAIDLNQDGIKDVVIVDRIGSRILPYVNHGTPGVTDYEYAPEFASFFPSVYGWMILKDYNCDGKEDFFTYGFGGIKVFKNTSDAVNGLSFELITNQLLSYQYTMYQGIFVTDVDYPAIEDIDGDGDLDILAFWIIGTYIHHHKNMSMELYGNCDSLDFRLNTQCWGYIREGDTSNAITMNASCPFFAAPDQAEVTSIPLQKEVPKATEHVGSTFLCLDLDADGDKDLLLGDVDYTNIIGLINGGTTDSARIISQDVFFPSYDTAVHLVSFPVANYVDVNNDNKRDLLVSPFDPSTLTTKSDQSVWLYLNHGEDNEPLFRLETKEFLQGEMIDVGTTSMPVVCDVDQDGLQDIVIGNYGFHDSSYYQSGFLRSVFRSRLVVLHNTGSVTDPVFEINEDDFAGISALKITNAFPAFGDVDGDGDLDMVLGNADGTLFFYRNNAGPGNPLFFEPPQPNYQNIDVGNASTPQLWDLDKDGLIDLVCGNKKGLLSYYRNTGSLQNPVFTYITDSLGKVDVRDANMSWDGYSVPCFFTGDDGSTRLFMGSLKGGLAYYKGIDGHLADTFTQVDQNYLFLRYGNNSAVASYDFDNDGFTDLIMGNSGGGLAYFKGTTPGPAGIPLLSGSTAPVCRLFPNPTQHHCWIDVSGNETNLSAAYEIFDSGGRRVLTGNLFQFPGYIEIPLNNGLYFLRLTFMNGSKRYTASHPLKMVVLK